MNLPPDQQSPFNGSVDAPGDAGVVLLPAAKVLKRYPIHEATLWRWIAAGIFPPPDKIINGRRYWFGRTLDAFDRKAS